MAHIDGDDKSAHIDGDDKSFLIFMAIIGAIFVVLILSASLFDGGGGPATNSVEACAEIENVEKSVACFKAIGEEN